MILATCQRVGGFERLASLYAKSTLTPDRPRKQHAEGRYPVYLVFPRGFIKMLKPLPLSNS